ncbi:hypothetical protein N9Z02_02725, partial [Akkermansiaceae bacterium]|nr:hypothetical protein [Akkermansiaceae bacterium]
MRWLVVSWEWLGERVSWVRASAPLLGIACGVLAGGFGIAHFMWAAVFLLIGLILVRRTAGWCIALLFVLFLTAWRAHELRPEEPSATRTSKSVEGELVVGRLTGVGDDERIGFLKFEDGEVLRVAIQECV